MSFSGFNKLLHIFFGINIGEYSLKALIQVKQKTREKELGTFLINKICFKNTKKYKQSTKITEDDEIHEEVSIGKGKGTGKGKRAIY